MCGIVGFIGEPLDSRLAFELSTNLLARTEIRGDDASGYWACDTLPEDQGCVYWTKAPKKASDFVKGDGWQAIKDIKLNLLISHCRRSTVRGSENKNRNNHPFLSSDSRTALVHNGNVPEFDSLRSDYDVMSECDSEILLRMMERGPHYNLEYLRQQLGRLKGSGEKAIKDCPDEEVPLWSHSLLGLVDIFARINYGAMAVAIGERWEDGTRALWLFRDRERPLQVIDMRESLNQVYVVSEKRIWREAVEATPNARRYVKGSTPIIEFPPMYIWLLTYREGEKNKFGVRKFRINRQRRHDTTFEEERPDDLVQPTNRGAIRVVTNLKHDHEQDHTNGVTAHEPTASDSTPVKKSDDKGKKTESKKNVSAPSPPTHTSSPEPDETSNQTYEDWPGEVYPFVSRYLTTFFEMPTAERSRPAMSQVVQLRTTAYSPSLSIPDPSDKAIVLGNPHYRDWANALKAKHGWHDRVRQSEGVAKRDIISLWVILREAREAWQAMPSDEPVSAFTNNLAPTDCFEHMIRLIDARTKVSHRPWPTGMTAGLTDTFKTLQEQLTEAAVRLRDQDEEFPDMTNYEAELTKDHYHRWAKVLQARHQWNDAAWRNGIDVKLFFLLSEVHNSWRGHMRTVYADVPFDADDPPSMACEAIGAANAQVRVRKPPFEDDEEEDEGENGDHEVERPLGVIRTDRMTVHESEPGQLDMDKVEEFNDSLHKLREILAGIDTGVNELIREKTINNTELHEIVDSLKDAVQDMEGLNIIAESYTKQAT